MNYLAAEFLRVPRRGGRRRAEAAGWSRDPEPRAVEVGYPIVSGVQRAPANHMTTTQTSYLPDTTEAQLLFRLLGIAHAVTDRLDAALGELGLSPATLDLLTELSNAAEPLSVLELAARVHDGDSGLGRLVERLERDGLVRRTGNPATGWTVTVVITSLGKERQRTGAERVGAVQQQLAQAMAAVDSVALERALAALR